MADRILVVDDEPDIAALVAYHLAKHGYRVTTAGDGCEAVRLAARDRPDLVVLDLMLPGSDGLEVLQELRRRPETAATGVILLTARNEKSDRLAGLSLGADDYVGKPFSPDELVLRVEAVLRRLRSGGGTHATTLHVDPVTMDLEAHLVQVDGRDVSLTALEFRLLHTLLERKGRVQSRSRLLQDVWGANPDIQTRTVDMHVQRLRSKLGATGDRIETIRGVGYRFRVTDSVATR